MAAADPSRALSEVLDRLAAFEPVDAPVLSLYLDTRANERGRDAFEPFLRKELRERAESYGASTREREAFEKDADRIREWLGRELRPSADAVAVFACGPAALFETAQLEVALPESRLVVAPEPYLLPLVQLIEQHPRFAALVADTNLARLFVFGLRRRVRLETVDSPKTKRHKMGGWSQMRYQRHVDDQYRKHAKEVVGVLARVVREEGIDQVILAGDEVVLPVLREQLPDEVARKVVDQLALDIRSPEHEVLEEALGALRRVDAVSDAERVRELLDDYRSGGLALVGVPAVLGALQLGQVHELVMSADARAVRFALEGEARQAAASEATIAADPETLPREVERLTALEGKPRLDGAELAHALVTLARRTDAKVKLVEDPELLRAHGGVIAALRFRLDRTAGHAARQGEGS